ncbi:MAG: phage tail tape measure protein, partial [Symploca sp. SIO1B1]|nr:phage tail tape measure protein [Symploca sp. SIO1B1]
SLLVTITTEPIVIGLVPPDYSSYSYGEKFIEYYKAVEQAIQLQTSLKNSIEDIRTIEDIIDQKSRQVLQKFSHQLALTERKVKEAEQDITQNHKDLLVLYKQEIIKVLKQEYPLTQDALQQLDKSQEIRGINSKIATAIRRQLTQEYEQKSQRYREDFRMLLYQKMLTPDQANQELQELQQELDLSTARVESLEAEVIPDYQRDKQWCQQKLEEAIRQIYPINSENIDELLRQQKRDLKQERGLNYQTIESISSVVVTRYKQHLQYYRETYTIIKRGCPAQDELTLLDNLSRFIADETACIIRAEVDDEIDDNIIKSKVDYERIFTQVIQQQHPNLPSEEFLENLRKASRLSQESIDSIEAKILERNGRTFSIPSVEKENEYSPPYSTKLRAWIDSDYQDKSQLLQGQELTEAQNWIDNYGWDRLNKKEQEFIKKSIVRNVL